MAAVRARGALETGADAVDRLRAIAEQFDTDPIYAYQHSTRTETVSPPPPHPNAIVSLEVSDGTTTQRFDAIPRNRYAMQDLAPGGHLTFEPTPAGRDALERFRQSLASGEQVTFDKGVTFQFSRMPELFDQITASPSDEARITVGPGQGLPPWNARLDIHSSNGDQTLDVDLRVEVAPTGWDVAFTGTVGQLEVQVLLRRRRTRGEATMHYAYHHDQAKGWRAMQAALDVLAAIHGDGTIEVKDRDNVRPTLPFDLPNLPVSDDMRWYRSLAQKMVLLEEAAGAPLVLPDPIGQDLYHAIVEAAYVIEHGESGMDFTSVTLDLPVDRFEEISRPNARLAVSVTMVLPVPDQDPPPTLGYLSGELTGWTIKSAEPVEIEGEHHVRTTIAPKDERSRHQRFAYSRVPVKQ
jgi:hypothetical protein